MNTINHYHISRIIVIILFSIFLSFTECNKKTDPIKSALDVAESLMESNPDSALSVIHSINNYDITGKSQKARYALLKSMALDKNFTDTTTFDVLQPAIDYYLKKGSPDEKLRTYYYQGRIYQNRNERDSALYSFIKGLENVEDCKDSLTIARTYVAQGVLSFQVYDINAYIFNYEKASNIYRNLADSEREFDCLLNVLNGSLVLNDQRKADSILYILNYDFRSVPETQNNSLHNYKLTYALQFETDKEVEALIERNGKNISSSIDGLLNLASAYSSLGENEQAINILDFVNKSGICYDTLRYLVKSVNILKDGGYYQEALSSYWRFSHMMDSINALKFAQNAKTVEEKHQIELQAQKDARKHSQIIWVSIGTIVFLGMASSILLLLLRSYKAKRKLAAQMAKTTMLENERLRTEKELAIQKERASELENENLKSERERLTLENANLQLERDKKALEAENLAHRVQVLEGESESLKALLDTSEEIPSEVQQAIKTRIEMLNSLLAGYITDNPQYEKPYESWIKELADDTEAFMNSNRLAFQASHPAFIRYFEDHDLTTSEINYVCLYAIGLRGKEVGNYMKKRSHVNISSTIRKKLGIDKHDTNIGIYVRKLLKSL